MLEVPRRHKLGKPPVKSHRACLGRLQKVVRCCDGSDPSTDLSQRKVVATGKLTKDAGNAQNILSRPKAPCYPDGCKTSRTRGWQVGW